MTLESTVKVFCHAQFALIIKTRARTVINWLNEGGGNVFFSAV